MNIMPLNYFDVTFMPYFRYQVKEIIYYFASISIFNIWLLQIR
jgi:hypothetical protein